MAGVIAFYTVLGTDINLGIFAYGYAWADDRELYEYPAITYVIAFLLFSVLAALNSMVLIVHKLVRLMALSARAERTQRLVAPEADA